MLLGLLLTSPAPAESLPECAFPRDDSAIYVLTVEPRPTVIHLFGHTALLAWDPARGARSDVYDYGRFRLPPSIVDTVVNYLTMQQTYFVGVNPLQSTIARYRQLGRGVIAQRLALTFDEAKLLQRSIDEQARRDPTFRYNWYDANCSTKIRDRIDEALGGSLREQLQSPSGTSPAAEVLRHSAGHPLWLGLQWGSTRYARQEITDWDAMYLPDPMRVRLAEATRPDGSPLVVETCRLLPDSRPPILERPPSRWAGFTILGLALGAGLIGLLRTSRTAGMVAVGVVGAGLATWGTAALVVGLAGTFAPFWGHDNLAFASPLWWLVPIAAWGAARQPDARWPAVVGAAILAVALLGLLGSLLFGFAAGNLGIAGLLLPVAGAVAAALGADRLTRPSPPEAASRSPAAD